MARHLAAELRVHNLRAANITSDVAGQVGSDIDTMGAQSGIFLVNALIGTSIPSNISFHTSDVSGFTPATANILAIRCDPINSESDIGDGISSNVIASINKSGQYLFEANNLERYVNVKYNGNGNTGSYFSVTFLGHDLSVVPWNTNSLGGRSAY